VKIINDRQRAGLFKNMPAHACDRSFRVHDNKRGIRLEPLLHLLNGLRRNTDK
jgi:hypothetical protein